MSAISGRIKEVATKKFDCSVVTEEFLLYHFEGNTFTAIAEAPTTGQPAFAGRYF